VKTILAVILYLLVATGLWAQEPGAPPAGDLASLLREAEAGSPAIRAAAARLEAARHTPSQASALPDPEFSIAYLNDGISSFTLGESPMTNLAFTWSQEVPHPGKRDLRVDVASRAADKTASELDLVRLEVLADVKAAYADLYRFDQTLLILADTRAVLGSLADAARRRYEVGDGAQESVLKAETEILRLQVEVARVSQDRRAAEIRLNASVGRSADTPIGTVTSIPEADLPEDVEGLADRAAASSPAIAALRADVLREEAGVRLAKVDLKSDYVWSASYQNRDGLDPMVMGSFGLRLPVYRDKRQRQAVLQKEADLRAVTQSVAEMEIQARAAVRALVSRYGRADRLRTLFGQGVIPQARATLASGESSYGVGRLGFLDLLNDLTVLLNARIDLVAQEAERLQALAALEPLVATRLIDVGEGPGGQGGGDAIND